MIVYISFLIYASSSFSFNLRVLSFRVSIVQPTCAMSASLYQLISQVLLQLDVQENIDLLHRVSCDDF
jgi:hypothetical protein